MPANDGKAAELAFLDHWEKVGHVERLRDRKDLIGLNRGAKLADFKKPADFMVSSPDIRLHYAEVKSTFADSFAFGAIQAGQSAAALKEAKRGHGDYIFYIFSYAQGHWYTMTCKEYEQFLNAGRRSVKFEELTLWHK